MTENHRTLHAVDVPISQAVKALEDLKFMGVTAATMFPGLDGACKMMRHDMLFRSRRTETEATDNQITQPPNQTDTVAAAESPGVQS